MGAIGTVVGGDMHRGFGPGTVGSGMMRGGPGTVGGGMMGGPGMMGGSGAGGSELRAGGLGRRQRWREGAAGAGGVAFPVSPGRLAAAITPEDHVAVMARWDGASAATWNRHLSALTSITAWAGRQDLLDRRRW